MPEKNKKVHISSENPFVEIGTFTAGVFNAVGRTVKGAAMGFAHAFKKAAPKEKSAFGQNAVCFFALVKENGFFHVITDMAKNWFVQAKNNKLLFSTAVNYTVPVVAIAVLVTAVCRTASTNYGISVECNGKDLGVVSEEAVVNNAAEKISESSEYYDTDNTLYISAKLSIKPLNALDEVMDEVALADKLEEEIVPESDTSSNSSENTVNDTEISQTDDEVQNELDGKIRAYAVTVDGEFIGAVSDNSAINNYIEGIKSQYLGENVVSVSFDKDIEYGYEQYVYPSDIVSEQSIIDKFSSVVSEPSYYTIQRGEYPMQIAADHGMTLDELKKCPAEFAGKSIDDITAYCPIGATIQFGNDVSYLNVVLTKKISYTGAIDFDVQYVDDDSLYIGESVVDVEGTEGTAAYEALVTSQGDTEISREITSETIITKPVTKVIRIGTTETSTPVSSGSGGSGTYFWPVDGGYISAYMGDGRGHKGIDIAAPYGTPIYAAASGTVSRASNKGDGYGNCIFIDQDDGNVTVYGHQSSLAVEVGDYVVAGQLIGYVGATGDATGNHLHFEVRSNGRYLDPLDYVKQE